MTPEDRCRKAFGTPDEIAPLATTRKRPDHTVPERPLRVFGDYCQLVLPAHRATVASRSSRARYATRRRRAPRRVLSEDERSRPRRPAPLSR